MSTFRIEQRWGSGQRGMNPDADTSGSARRIRLMGRWPVARRYGVDFRSGNQHAGTAGDVRELRTRAGGICSIAVALAGSVAESRVGRYVPPWVVMPGTSAAMPRRMPPITASIPSRGIGRTGCGISTSAARQHRSGRRAGCGIIGTAPKAVPIPEVAGPSCSPRVGNAGTWALASWLVVVFFLLHLVDDAWVNVLRMVGSMLGMRYRQMPRGGGGQTRTGDRGHHH